MHQAVEDSDGYRVLPGVVELRPRLVDEGYMLGLVTGNVEAAAHIKLHRARLNRFFSFGGHGSDSDNRGDITRIALKRASFVYGDNVQHDGPQTPYRGSLSAMASCSACGAGVAADAKFCSSCGAPVQPLSATDTAPPVEVSSPATSIAEPRKRYGGLFGNRNRDKDFRAHVERALDDDLLTVAEEDALFAWAGQQGITQKDWHKKFGDLFDRMLIASVNDGRLPDLAGSEPAAPVMLKGGETAHWMVAASLMKEVGQREMRGGGSGVSFRVAKGVRFHTGVFRAKSVVVGTSLEPADAGVLTVTSLRTVFTGQRMTLDLPHAKLAHLNVFTDGISFNMSNRQTVPLFKVPNGQVVAAMINAAIQRLS